VEIPVLEVRCRKLRTDNRSRHRDGTANGYWTVSKVFGALFLWFFAFMVITGGWGSYTESRDRWEIVFASSFALLLFSIPLLGYSLRNRPQEIRCPQMVRCEGRPVIHFPGDRRAVPVSAFAYALLGFTGIAASMTSWTGHVAELIPFGLPSAFVLTYTLFALLGRFDESGTVLDETGVTIRARGLRAQIPWSSIKGAEIVRHRPFPYPRVAIRLHPGTPREVSTTVPWWIGSPRPRRDTVYLTKVQIPGMITEVPSTTPVPFIRAFAQHPPSRKTLQELVDEPSSEPTITI
jgi:hypothetical protein